MDGIIFIIFPFVFFTIFSIVVFTVVSQVFKMQRSKNLPTVTSKVKILRKRKVKNNNINRYYITFLFESNDEFEINVPACDYDSIEQGDILYLTFKGYKFIAFSWDEPVNKVKNNSLKEEFKESHEDFLNEVESFEKESKDTIKDYYDSSRY